MTVIPSLVDGVMARLTNHDTIVQGCGTSELDVADMMRLRRFAIGVARSAGFAQSFDTNATTGTAILLPRQRQLLGYAREFTGSLHGQADGRSFSLNR